MLEPPTGGYPVLIEEAPGGFIIEPPRATLSSGGLLVLLDVSPSMDGRALHHARSLVGLLLDVLPEGSVEVVGFCSRVKRPRGNPLSLRVCAGTNIEGALRFALDAHGGRPVIVVTDAHPTVGSRKPARLSRLAEALGGRLVLALIGRPDWRVARLLADASGGPLVRLSGDLWSDAWGILALAGACRRCVTGIALAHPPWLEVLGPNSRSPLPWWSFLPLPPPGGGALPLVARLRAGWESPPLDVVALPVLARILAREGRRLGGGWALVGAVEVSPAGRDPPAPVVRASTGVWSG